MGKYEIISFDMFQTLVDVNKRIPDIWKGILKEKYTKEKGIAGANAVLENLSTAYKHSLRPFHDMKEMFTDCARNAIPQIGYPVAPEDIAYHLMYQHGYAPFFEDTLPVLKKLRNDYRLILSSDSSHLMVDPLLQILKFEKAFISDDLECYKGDLNGRFFHIILSQLKMDASKILHIGDSSADFIGAHAAGIDCCFINRDHRTLHSSTKPDYEIYDLGELMDILY